MSKKLKNVTLLLEAVEMGETDTAMDLIAKGADVNVALVQAIKNLAEPCVEELAKFGADVNWKGASRTPLMEAAILGSVPAIKKLIQAGAKVDEENKSGDTALVYAAKRGFDACVRLLLAAQPADARLQKYKALTASASKGSEDCVKILLDAGADVDMQKNIAKSPLMLAAEVGSEECVKILIEAGADVNVKKQTSTPLIGALPHSGCVEFLIKNGADVNLRNSRGDTPLVLAMQLTDWESSVKSLVHNGADINLMTKSEKCALFIAVTRKDWESRVKALLAGGAKLEIESVHRALLYAARDSKCASECCFKWLKERGADVNVQDSLGQTPLINVVNRLAPNEGLAKFLLDSGANVNLRRRMTDRHSALMCAAQWKHSGLVNLLLDRGANVNFVNWDGDTALLIAMKSTPLDLEIVRLLCSAGTDVNKTPQKGLELVCRALRCNVDVVPLFLAGVHAKGAKLQDFDCLPFTSEKQKENAKIVLKFGRVSDGEVNQFLAKAAQTEIEAEAAQTEIEAGEDLSPEVMTLQNLSRIAVRNHLIAAGAPNLFAVVPKLILPKVMKEYLLFGQNLKD